jgi:hypothetical protein
LREVKDINEHGLLVASGLLRRSLDGILAIPIVLQIDVLAFFSEPFSPGRA